MLYNVIFPAETNFPNRSRYAFYFMFSLLIKVFVMTMTVLLFQSNLYEVAHTLRDLKNVFTEKIKHCH